MGITSITTIAISDLIYQCHTTNPVLVLLYCTLNNLKSSFCVPVYTSPIFGAYKALEIYKTCIF